jgi:hypothetical protein
MANIGSNDLEFTMDTTSEHNETMLNFMRLLGNADRLKIAGMLGIESLTAAQLAERLHLSLEIIQQHLELLVSAGLVRTQGPAYALENKTLEYLSRQVLAQSHPPSAAQEFDGDEYERKVLKSYIAHDGSLKAIPNQQKKLLVILHHLVKIFEPGQRYPEMQVNEMLRKYHGDTAALRRYLVDSRLLAREKGVYWRV